MALCKIISSNLRLLRIPNLQQISSSRKYDVQQVVRRANQLSLNQLLEQNDQLDSKKWSTVRKEILASISTVNESNVDNIIINRCCDANKHFLALNYISYLVEERKQNLNIASIIKYFKLLYNYKQPIDSEDEKRIYEYYDEIRKKYVVLDALTIEGCIIALSLTNRWKECIELFEQNENHCEYSSLIYTSIIVAAFNHDEPEIAWSFLERIRGDKRVQKKVYGAYINFCQRHFHHFDELKNAVERMFDYWIRHDIYPHITTITAFMQFLSNTGHWNSSPTTITKEGICQCCHHSLPDFKMSKEDHETLLKYILNHVIVGKDVFEATTPTELNQFLKFIDQIKPYDIVIDGLNTAYSMNRKSKVAYDRARELRKTVSLLKERNKKILVLGKRHMLKWSKKEMSMVEKMSYIFLTNNTSKDDLFTIYAALASGCNTYVVTRDFLRDHKFILSDLKVKRIFRYWQLTHQIMPYYTNIDSFQQIGLAYPPSYVTALHEDKGNWHIPYIENLETSDDEKPTRWICLRLNRKIENEESSQR